MDEGAIATCKAYYLRDKPEQAGGPNEEGFKGIMGREQLSSGNTEHCWTMGFSHNRRYEQHMEDTITKVHQQYPKQNVCHTVVICIHVS
jgi:hypothetical protein